MGSLFDRYSKFHKPKGGNHGVVITVSAPAADEQPERNTGSITILTPKSEDLTTSHEGSPEYSEQVKSRLRILMEQENHLRNQREKYRMKYYEMEIAKAPQADFAANYATIQALTDQLAPIYLERKRIEHTGEIQEIKVLTTADELQIDSWKLKKKRLHDKKYKLDQKIKGYAGFAKGVQNLSVWESQLEDVKLEIYGIDQELEKMQQ